MYFSVFILTHPVPTLRRPRDTHDPPLSADVFIINRRGCIAQQTVIVTPTLRFLSFRLRLYKVQGRRERVIYRWPSLKGQALLRDSCCGGGGGRDRSLSSFQLLEIITMKIKNKCFCDLDNGIRVTIFRFIRPARHPHYRVSHREIRVHNIFRVNTWRQSNSVFFIFLNTRKAVKRFVRTLAYFLRNKLKIKLFIL